MLIQRFQQTHRDPAVTASTPPAVTGTSITTHITLQRATLFGNTEDPRFKAIVVGVMTLVGLVLLVACANVANMLLARGLIRSEAADPGYATAPVYITALAFGASDAGANGRARSAITRLQTLPAVQGVAVVERPPMLATWTIPMRVADGPAAAGSTLANRVSGSYFDTMGIPLLRGRTFSPAEEKFGARVAVISDAAARLLWPGQNPIGRAVDFILVRDGAWERYEVVGVATDVRTANLTRLDPAMVYFPAAEQELATFALAIRIRGDGPAALSSIGAALVPFDARFASGFSPMNLQRDVVRNQQAISRTLSLSAASLALLALVLAAAGIYGVASFMVSQRAHEVGLRVALGATPRDVLRLMLGEALQPVTFGGAVGLAGAVAVSALGRAALTIPSTLDPLYGAGSFDPVTFAAVPVFLALVALTATYGPARRALRVDPIVTLRRE